MRTSLQKSSERRSSYVLGACLAVGTLGAVFAAVADFRSVYVNRTGVPVAGLVTAVVAASGVALGAVIRILSGSAASFGAWVRRSSAGALLLIPAALVLTRTFLADGWDFSDCGTLLARYRPTAANLVDFRSACDAAADDRLTRVLVWVAVGCVVAGGYGLWLRCRGQHGPRAD